MKPSCDSIIDGFHCLFGLDWDRFILDLGGINIGKTNSMAASRHSEMYNVKMLHSTLIQGSLHRIFNPVIKHSLAIFLFLINHNEDSI